MFQFVPSLLGWASTTVFKHCFYQWSFLNKTPIIKPIAPIFSLIEISYKLIARAFKQVKSFLINDIKNSM
jgi:hypothetical protein